MLPRLLGYVDSLERQRAAMGTRGGAGERVRLRPTGRIIIRKPHLQTEGGLLKKIDRQMAVQRSNRGAMGLRSLAGVPPGTDADEPHLPKSEVFAENKLFRHAGHHGPQGIFDNLPFLLSSDTVGLSGKLPTELIESNKSTLDEVREADLLVHGDIPHPCSSRSRSTW